MMDVLLEQDEDAGHRWRLLVLEDTGDSWLSTAAARPASRGC